MSGGTRVSIPNNVWRMIQDIREIAGKHSDDDIYAMLKECNMDPNETAQKLLYIDTFHEVKKKRDRKNVNMSSRSEEYRWTSGTKGRSTRGGRGGYSSPYMSDDAGGGKNVSARKENGVNNRTQKGSRPSMPVLHRTENNATTHPSHSSTVASNGPVNMLNESSSHGSVPQRSAGVSSSASDPVLDPSLNTRVPGAVGAIKRDFGNQFITAEVSATLIDGNKSTSGQDVAKTSPAASEVVNSTCRTSPRKSHEVEGKGMSEPSEFSSLPTDNGSRAIGANLVPRLQQQPSDPSKVVATEPSTVSIGNSQSLTQNDSILEEATAGHLDSKLEKLNISLHQTVIFPDHLQVPEAFKSQLTFGSLDSIFGPKDSSSVSESIHVNSEAPKETSLINDIVSSSAQDVDLPDHQQPPQQVPENLKPLEDNNVSPASVLKYEQSKQETISPPGGPQFSLPQSTPPDYNFGIVPPLIGSHLVQLEGAELQARDISRNPDLVNGKSPVPSTSGSTPSATQPATVAQSSIAVSPQLYPFFQQPYPPNCFPYNPYFPHVFFSQNTQQFLSHNGFPQQPSTGNVYMPPPAAAAATPGAKLPVPSQYKLGTNTGNLTTHLGIPSGHATYGSSAVGYSPNAAVMPGNSASTEELATSDLKEKSSHSTMQQGEDSRVWSSATGREIPNLQANYFYNLPQGQHLAFSPAQAGHGSFAGLYHPSQTNVTPPTVRSLIHRSHATAGSVDSVVPPHGPYQQQPRIAQMNWNSTILNRENM